MKRDDFMTFLLTRVDELPEWHSTLDGAYYCIIKNKAYLTLRPNTVVIQDGDGSLSTYGITANEYAVMIRTISPKTEIDLPESERLLITPGNNS